jgi:hypothetical protein
MLEQFVKITSLSLLLLFSARTWAEPSADPALLRSLQERIDKANAAAQAHRYSEAIPLLESIYSEKLPTILVGLRADVAYGLACNYARLGQKENALEALARSVHDGFTDAEHARTDEDLAPLRTQPRFSKLLSEMKEADYRFRVFHVTSWMNPDLAPADIKFDSLDDSKTVALRERYDLEKTITGKATELDQQLAVLAWVHNRWAHSGLDEPSHPDALTILDEVAHGKRFRCVEYSITLAQALTALGFPARVIGLRREGVSYGSGKGHVVTEAWNNQLGKWLVLDGQNNATWEVDGHPLSAVEIRDLRLAGKTAALKMNHHGSTWMPKPPEMSDWLPYFHYISYSTDNAIFQQKKTGKPEQVALVPRDTGPELLFQGTPTSDIHSVEGAHLYPSLNNVHVNLTASRKGDGPSETLSVRLTNSCPWTCRYEIVLNGRHLEQAEDHLAWTLHSGANSIEVRARNALGRLGPSSRVDLVFYPPPSASK